MNPEKVKNEITTNDTVNIEASSRQVRRQNAFREAFKAITSIELAPIVDSNDKPIGWTGTGRKERREAARNIAIPEKQERHQAIRRQNRANRGNRNAV